MLNRSFIITGFFKFQEVVIKFDAFQPSFQTRDQIVVPELDFLFKKKINSRDWPGLVSGS